MDVFQKNFEPIDRDGENMENKWVVYILQCSDGSLYTGITDNLQRRLTAHNCGKGAKYTRGRTPLILRYVELCVDRSAALRREIQIKRLRRQEKIDLISKYKESKQEASECRIF